MLKIFKCIREKRAIKTQCVVYMGIVDIGVGGEGVGEGNTAKVTASSEFRCPEVAVYKTLIQLDWINL